MLQKLETSKFLKSLKSINKGSLVVTTPNGKKLDFYANNEGPHAELIINDWNFISSIISKGSVGFAESYRDKIIDTPNLTELLKLILINEQVSDPYYDGNLVHRIIYQAKNLIKNNNRKNSIKNIHAHYDIGNNFYKLWLDKSMHYSSAIFHHNQKKTSSLFDAQRYKCQNIIDKFSKPGKILEIGCGWGGFAEQATQHNHFDFKGITISQEQFSYAKDRLKNKALISFEDYRDQNDKYDYIASIEMIEAVGEKYWSTYFQKIKNLLNPKGKAIIQSILISDKYFNLYRKRDDFIRHFIFPGGMLPSPQIFKQEASKAGLKVVSSLNFGQDYATTLSCWLNNFEKQIPKVYQLGFDENFVRIWRMYLASCIATFLSGVNDVAQIHLEHS